MSATTTTAAFQTSGPPTKKQKKTVKAEVSGEESFSAEDDKRE
jgi:hypothetical protein